MLDPASLPEKPVFPKPSLFLGLGAALGLLIGLGAALLAEYLDPTVKDSEILQAVQGYPLLASIPHFPEVGDANLQMLQARYREPEPERRKNEPDPSAWGPPPPGEAAFRLIG